jgi:hypothetical protein
MKDYYEILGLYEEASQEEIHARWMELTRKYQTDRAKRGTDEKLMEISAAYKVLKDPATRAAYDFDRDLKKSVLRKVEIADRKRRSYLSRVIPPIAIAVVLLALGSYYFLFSKSEGPTRKAEVVPVAPSKPEISTPAGKEIQPIPPAKPTGAEITEAVPKPPVTAPQPPASKDAPPKVFTPPVSKPEEPPRVAKEIVREPPKKETAALAPPLRQPPAKEKMPPAVVSKPAAPVRVAEETTRRETAALAPSLRETPPKASPPVVSKPAVPAKREELPPVVRETPRIEPERVLPKPTPAEPPQPAAVLPPPAPRPREEVRPIRETPAPEPVRTIAPEKPATAPTEVAKVEAPKPAFSEPPRTAPPPVAVPAPALKPQEPAKSVREAPRESGPPPLAREEEVIQFLTRYVNQYVGRNTDGLMSFFSPQAVQNNKFDYNAIKRMYGKFFDESQKLSYKVSPQAIDISSREAKVRATYLLEQETRNGEIKMWRGNIEWTLVREQGVLKVRTLQFQHTEKP